MCRYPKDRCIHIESNEKRADFGYVVRYDEEDTFHGTCFRAARGRGYMFTVGHTDRFGEDLLIVPYHYRVVNLVTSQATGKRRVPPDPGVRSLR